MKDIYDTTLICNKCGSHTTKSHVTKNNFDIRIWFCPDCKKKWYHPEDMKAYERYLQLKKKDFQVKLRSVGNSWVISIPKEIIRFQQDKTKTQIVKLNLDEPGKITLKFARIRKLIKGKQKESKQ